VSWPTVEKKKRKDRRHRVVKEKTKALGVNRRELQESSKPAQKKRLNLYPGKNFPPHERREFYPQQKRKNTAKGKGSESKPNCLLEVLSLFRGSGRDFMT